MKTILSILALLCALHARASTIIFQNTNWNLSATYQLTNTIRIAQVPTNSPTVIGNAIESGLPIYLQTTNGLYTNSFAPGTYNLQILNGAGYPFNGTLYFQSFADTNTYYFTNVWLSGGNIFVSYPQGSGNSVTNVGISFTPTNGLNLTTNSGTTFLGLITNYNGTLTFTNATNQFGGSIVDPAGNTIFKDIGGITEIFPPGGSSAAAVTFSPAATVFNAPDNIVALEWLSGTNVFAPNQTATNASSVLTKGIADTLYASIGSGGAASSNYLVAAFGSAFITNALNAASFTGAATNPFTATNDVRAVKLTNAANILGGNGAALTGLPTNVFDLNIFSVTGTGVTMASGATPTNVSMQGTANGANTFYPTNMPNIGDAYRMANNAVGYSSWFFNGNANQQNIGQQNSDAELRFYNINPFQSGGGFAVTPTTTNAFGSALSTNTDGQKIYLQENDPHKYSILGVNSQDITNNIPGSLLFVANVGQATNDQIAFAAAKSVGGQSGNYSWIFMSMDANAVQYTHFPIHAAQAYAPTNSHWGVDALYIDHGLGRVGANNLYVTNLFFVNGSQWNSGASSNLINLALADPVQTLKISKIIPNGYTTAGALMFDAGNNGSGLFFPISDGNLHFANGAVDAGHLDGSSPPNWIFNNSGTFTNSVTTSNLTVTATATLNNTTNLGTLGVGGNIYGSGSLSVATMSWNASPTNGNGIVMVGTSGGSATLQSTNLADAIQKATSSQFGTVKVDGTTITASGGVISSVGGGGGSTNNVVTAQGTSVTTNNAYAGFFVGDGSKLTNYAYTIAGSRNDPSSDLALNYISATGPWGSGNNCYVWHPVTGKVAQYSTGATGAPFGRLYFNRDVMLTNLDVFITPAIGTGTNFAVGILTNDAFSGIQGVLVGNTSTYHVTDVSHSTLVKAGSYIMIGATNNYAAGDVTINITWSFDVLAAP